MKRKKVIELLENVLLEYKNDINATKADRASALLLENYGEVIECDGRIGGINDAMDALEYLLQTEIFITA
jgi:hypothetical protein